MKEIGGFFELELEKKEEYHKHAIKLNTGRNSLEYVLRSSDYKKVYLPRYTCSSVMEPINKLGIKYEYYSIDINFNIQLDLSKLWSDELLIYTNYFGICDEKVDEVIKSKKIYGFELCIDNTQSFFSYPRNGVHTIYSARKFFGVPDGAYLYTNKVLEEPIQKGIGYDKFSHLIKRIEVGSNMSYGDFINNSKLHCNQPIREMSRISERILNSIDYDRVMKKRWQNFNYLNNILVKTNEVNIDINKIKCPMVYPYLVSSDINLREYLISKGIYTAQYWPEVFDIAENNSEEYKLTSKLTPIPIDQRYDLEDMEYILDNIKYVIKDIIT